MPSGYGFRNEVLGLMVALRFRDISLRMHGAQQSFFFGIPLKGQ